MSEEIIGPGSDIQDEIIQRRYIPNGFVRPAVETHDDKYIYGRRLFNQGIDDRLSFTEQLNIRLECRFYYLAGLCYGGHYYRIKTLLARISGPCDDTHLSYACLSGQVCIVELIWKHVSQTNITLNNAMFDAGRGGSIDILAWLIEHGATNCNAALHGACRNGHSELADAIISLGATDYNEGLNEACRGGHINLVKKMRRYGATNLNSGFKFACRNGHYRVMRYLANQGAKKCKCNKPSFASHFWFPCCYI
jgi:hypothetical protein